MTSTVDRYEHTPGVKKKSQVVGRKVKPKRGRPKRSRSARVRTAATCDPSELCRHCQSKVGSRPKRLCTACYANAAVRDSYPPVSKYGNRTAAGKVDHLTAHVAAAVDVVKCLHAPGTPGKLQTLEERAAAGLSLWNTEDVGPAVSNGSIER